MTASVHNSSSTHKTNTTTLSKSASAPSFMLRGRALAVVSSEPKKSATSARTGAVASDAVRNPAAVQRRAPVLRKLTTDGKSVAFRKTGTISAVLLDARRHAHSHATHLSVPNHCLRHSQGTSNQKKARSLNASAQIDAIKKKVGHINSDTRAGVVSPHRLTHLTHHYKPEKAVGNGWTDAEMASMFAGVQLT